MAIKDPPQPLSFPPLTYAKLSPGPFLLAHLLAPTPLRPNARPPHAFRPLTAHAGSLAHAHGSAVVRIGDTAVVCGVRGEILLASDTGGYRPSDAEPQADREDAQAVSKAKAKANSDTAALAALDLLVPNIELATGCSPAHLPGAAPSALAQSLSQRVLSLLLISHLVPFEQLQIRPPLPPPSTSNDQPSTSPNDPPPLTAPKAFWTLYIDILILSLDGAPFDAAWAAVLAALRDTRLPRAWWDEDAEQVLCSPLRAEGLPLGVRGWPVASSFAVLEEEEGGRKWVLADPDGFEEGVCGEGVTVVVDAEGGGVLRVEKSGGGGVGVEEMRGCVEMAGGRAREWVGVLGRT
ncbi:hypothetical protein MMC13_004202 [Lambiella insularis]|nr:hypothetical protein [Lambiella insularis]